MPLYRTYKKGDLRVGVWKVEETIDQLRSKFNDFSLYESGLRKFKAEKRQLEWLAVRVLLKELLGDKEMIGFVIQKSDAVIFPSNIASQKAFENAGYQYHHTYEDGTAMYYVYEGSSE